MNYERVFLNVIKLTKLLHSIFFNKKNFKN